ncbi:MAG TPA: VOC family protein [Candidatus Nitrosocosmicus sp.]
MIVKIPHLINNIIKSNKKITIGKLFADGYYSLTPYLNLKDASKAIDFYKKAFDAKEQMRMMAPDGKSIIHAELTIGNSRLMLADENKDRNYLSPTTQREFWWDISTCRRCR